MNDSRRTGLLRLRHLREVNEAHAEEMNEMRERFAQLANPAAAPRVVSAFNLFQTPEPLAARVAQIASDGRAFGRTLEPSAGLGRLYRAVRAIDAACPVVLVEQSPDCSRELYIATNGDGNARLVQGDFLTQGYRLMGAFDTILMNPPFKMGTDTRHVKHALTLLAPGGRLVSITANGPKQQERLRPLASQWIELPAGSFKTEGTNVNAAILVIDR